MTPDPVAPAVLEDPRDAIPRLLARRGYRITAPRRAVLDALATSQEPRTVAQLHGALSGERVNLVSVYRPVKGLWDVGLVRGRAAAQGQRRYELAEPFTAHHHHLICRQCGQIEDVDGCLVEPDVLARMGRRVRQSHRFRVTDHELRFFGVCRRCDTGA